MNYKLQPSPTFSTRVHLPISRPLGALPANRADAKFFRSWLVYDSGLETNRTPGRVNWNMVLGIALAAAFSVCFWAGVGLMIVRTWK